MRLEFACRLKNQCHQSFPLYPEPDLKSIFFSPKFKPFMSLQSVPKTILSQSKCCALSGEFSGNMCHHACLLPESGLNAIPSVATWNNKKLELAGHLVHCYNWLINLNFELGDPLKYFLSRTLDLNNSRQIFMYFLDNKSKVTPSETIMLLL